ncbi:uncharacterized protein N7503_003570 [Penicillium pulvis]|uniref:uncharacterized protein n=1 Tax=Penicillium pulvis TaxID=1562058 RepID=UPI002546F63F|nr:uncharacterized protein N7503_003570 [Penicillium pulvis]KAJ5805968.1 hypothetical protein N7503_003570 [Penicillium pulvis]
MGGKPWQSTGCENCKKRKVKCDKQEPECERCMKRGIQCPGYDQYRIFLHNTSTTQSEEKKKKKPAGSKQSFALQTQTQPQYLSRARPVTIQQPTTVHNGPSKREQLFSVYINTYFPENVLGSTALDPWYSLLSGVSAIPNKPIMLEKAIAAKACIFLGRANNDNSMFHHGLQLYNSAIHHMSLHLNRKRNIYSDELVYTVAVFQQLVSCHCPHGLEVWLDQVKVTNGILKYCHNRANQNPIIKQLYVAFHRMRLLQSLSPLQEKEAIDLAADQFPFSLKSSEDQSVDDLLQLLSEISPFINAITTIVGSNRDACRIVLYDCITHRQKLFEWYESSVDLIGGRPSTCETLITKLPPSTHLFGTPYRFSSLDNSRVHGIFWSALSILQTLIGQAEAYIHCLSPSGAATNEDILLAEFYTDEISRSLPYWMANDMKSWGGHAAIFPLGQSCKFYLEFRRRDKFLYSQLGLQLIGDLGSDFAKRLSEMLWYGWNLIEGTDKNSIASLSPAEEISPVAEHVTITKVPGPSESESNYITPESI